MAANTTPVSPKGPFQAGASNIPPMCPLEELNFKEGQQTAQDHMADEWEKTNKTREQVLSCSNKKVDPVLRDTGWYCMVDWLHRLLCSRQGPGY